MKSRNWIRTFSGCLKLLIFIKRFQIVTNDMTDIYYEVLNMETSGELDKNALNLTLNFSSLIQSPSVTSIDTITPKDECQSGTLLFLFIVEITL